MAQDGVNQGGNIQHAETSYFRFLSPAIYGCFRSFSLCNGHSVDPQLLSTIFLLVVDLEVHSQVELFGGFGTVCWNEEGCPSSPLLNYAVRISSVFFLWYVR
jgi:hypothetical protein